MARIFFYLTLFLASGSGASEVNWSENSGVLDSSSQLLAFDPALTPEGVEQQDNLDDEQPAALHSLPNTDLKATAILAPYRSKHSSAGRYKANSPRAPPFFSK